jgi:trk system potassium uptake protein TrkH
MLLRPSPGDVQVIVRVTGLTLSGVGVATLGMAFVGLALGDVNSASALTLGAGVGLALGAASRWLTDARAHVSWTRGTVGAVTSWITASLVAAIPLYLSGHYGSYLDGVFEALSGLTTTGLTMVQDLDHLPTTMMLYRSLLHLLGGLAIVMVGITLLSATAVNAASMQATDIRDARIIPSLGQSWRRVVQIGAAIFGVGIPLLFAVMVLAGVPLQSAVPHAIAVAISAGATGGFAPTSLSVAYYHSIMVELAVLPLMIAGALSFLVHVDAWRGARRHLLREFEIRVFLTVIGLMSAVVVLGLGRSGAQTELEPLFRRGVFTAVSAATTTGLSVVPARVIATDWGLIAPAALVAAMTIGGMTGSTAGGLKPLRVGLILKGVMMDVKRVLLPESALVATSFRMGRSRPLTDAHVRSASSLLLIFLVATLGGAVTVLFVDARVDLTEALFASTSAASNGGLSVGAVTPSMRGGLKAGFMALMLLGRLEWMAVFSALGFVVAGLRGRR